MGSFERVLVGTDYSDCSRVALRLAAHFGRSCGAEVHVAHVIDTLGDNPLVDAYRAAVDTEGFLERLRARSEVMMEDTLSQAEISDPDMTRVHLPGARPADVLLDYARRERMDMIIAGTHGRRGFERLLIGSVALKLARESALPVLVARDPGLGSTDVDVRRILVPLDLSVGSVLALRAAHSLASVFHAQLDLIHVLEHYSMPVSLSRIKTLRELVPDIETRVRHLVDIQIEALEGPYIPNRVHVREGAPAPVILDLAEELACNLVVLSRRGLSASERFVLGSVTQKVLHGAPCSVCVVPAASRDETG